MDKLKEVSGFQDIIFVHANGFIGGAESKKSVILMGELSLWSLFIKSENLFS